MSDLVSILVRSSGRPELADALRSLLAQTHRNLEVVVVNVTGQPHPPLPEPAAQLNVKFVDSDRPLPRPQAANAAIDAANGDHALFLDDDDMLEPEHVAFCLSASRSYPGTIPFSGALLYDETDIYAIWPALGFGQLEVLQRNRMPICAPLVPRAVLREGLRFDPDLPIFEDWDFWIRLSRQMRLRPMACNTVVCRLGLGHSGTGVGVNFDPQRTTRESQPFHQKWDRECVALAEEFEGICADADAAAANEDWQHAEDLSWRAHELKVWDVPTLRRLSRIFGAKGDHGRSRRFAKAAERAQMMTPPPLSHAALVELHAHLTEGNALAMAGDEVRAESEFLAALAIRAGDQTACNGLANLRIARGRLPEAEHLLRQGTTWGDWVFVPLLLKRGRVLEQLGRRNEARDIYQHLASLAPRYAPVRDRLRAIDAIAAAEA